MAEVSERDARIACSLSLFFFLLHPPQDDDLIYRMAVQQSQRYPQGSYRNVFWWGMRTWERFDNGQWAADIPSFWEYVDWKFEAFNKGFCHREGPKW